MRFFLFILIAPSFLHAQDGAFRYFVSFTDKANTSYSLDNPEEFLSSKTISKRQNFSIEIDSTDLPVSTLYVDSINSLGFLVENKSKWFNGLIISTYDSLLFLSLDYNFIDSIIFFGSWHNNKSISEKWTFNHSFNLSNTQLQMLGADLMHSKGYKGNGIRIAVIDAGFLKVDTLDIFSNLNEQIVSTYDFVDGNPNVYDDHDHGTMVLSALCSQNQFIGSAPDAEYILLRSEDVFSENLIEEFLWVIAAEYADSLGADIINSSLGYTTFDDSDQNHTFLDMDGNTTPVSIGAGLACDKGIIVVNSAGNYGNSDWYYIGAPADNVDVITVGAVDENKELALFSSNGPNANGLLKPNIVAQGKNTVVINSNNEFLTANGTSFSSPITAGMIACLWGANKDKDSHSIKEAVYKSGDKYLNPDNQFGYGIPNYYIAHQYLNYDFTIPIDESIIHDVVYTVYTFDGKIVDSGVLYYNYRQDFIKILKPKTSGVYLLSLVSENFSINKKIIVVK